MGFKLFFFVLIMAPTSVFAAAHDVYGLWLTEARDGHVEISDAGDGTPIGTLVWVDPQSTDTQQDARNLDEALRSRPLVGVPIVWGFVKGKSGWRRGHIYNPEDGKTFRSSMALQDDGSLKVKGCLGPFCRTNFWTPVRSSSKGGQQ